MEYTKYLYWSPFSINLQAKEVQFYLNSHSFTGASLKIFWNFWDLVFMKQLTTNAGILESGHSSSTYAKFSEKLTFLPPDTHTSACVSRGLKC